VRRIEYRGENLDDRDENILLRDEFRGRRMRIALLCYQLRRWRSSSYFGTWCKMRSSVKRRIKSLGSSQKTANTQLNLHTMFNLEDLSAPSDPFGLGLTPILHLVIAAGEDSHSGQIARKELPCNPLCPLCNVAPESAQHICLQCPFRLHRGSARLSLALFGLYYVRNCSNFNY